MKLVFRIQFIGKTTGILQMRMMTSVLNCVRNSISLKSSESVCTINSVFFGKGECERE